MSMINALITQAQIERPGGVGGGNSAQGQALAAAGANGATEVVQCPPSLVGRVIGRQGETIRDIQVRTGAAIQIDQSGPRDTDRPVSISGSAESVAQAKKMVLDVIESATSGGGSANGGGGLGVTAGQPSRTCECEKQFVGRLIGSRGSTVTEMQRRANCLSPSIRPYSPV